MRTSWAIALALGSGAGLSACGSRTGLGVTGDYLGNGGSASSTTATSASSSSSAAASSSSSTAASSSSSTSSGIIEVCPAGCPMGTPDFPPALPLVPPGLPPGCAGGFEMNNTQTGSFTAPALPPGGANAVTLDVQIATYKAPDHIRITGVDAANDEYTLLEECNLQTATYGDPTNGCTRPPDDSIRQYKAAVKAGTKSLTFDVSGACTPQYLRVLGLCDFAVTPPFPGCKFRLVP